MKNNLQENNSRVDEAENQINDLEHKEANQKNKKKKESKKMGVVWAVSGTTSSNPHSHHRGDRNRRERPKIGNLFEKIMKENFPNLMKKIDIQVQEAWRIPNKMDVKRPAPRHIILKMSKAKDK